MTPDLENALAARLLEVCGDGSATAKIHRRADGMWLKVGSAAAPFLLAREAIRQMRWAQYDSGGYNEWELTLAPEDWTP